MTVAALAFAIIAVSFTGNEAGPFFRRSGDDGLLLAQSFSAIVGLTGLILASVTYQRRQAERRAQHLAHDLQAELLPPKLPEIPEFEAAGWYRAGAQGQEAGGDFYDAFETSGGRWVAVIGDVCGKGPEAASLTALARYTLRAVGREATGPSDALRKLNEAILEQRSDQRFMTAVMVQLDVGDHEQDVALSNGGIRLLFWSGPAARSRRCRREAGCCSGSTPTLSWSISASRCCPGMRSFSSPTGWPSDATPRTITRHGSGSCCDRAPGPARARPRHGSATWP